MDTSSHVIAVLTGFPPKPPVPPVPAIFPVNQAWLLKDGSRAKVKMATAFNAPGVLYNEGEDAVRRVLDQYARWFTDLRIFTMYRLNASNIGEFVLTGQQFIDVWCRLVEILAEYTMRPWPVAYTSTNDPNHWPNLLTAIRASSVPHYLSWVNELDQKANYIDSLNRMLICEPNRMGVLMPNGVFISQERPTDIIWSQGSNGSQQIGVKPFAKLPNGYTESHWNLSDQEQRKIAHNSAEDDYNGGTHSIAATETSRFPDGGGMWVSPNTTHEMAAYDTGRASTVFAIPMCLHTVPGKKFALFDEQCARIAKKFSDGCDSVPLDGPYRFPEDYSHRRAREYPGVVWPTGLLRSYEMGPPTQTFTFGVDIHGPFVEDPPPDPNPGPDPIPPDPTPHQMKVGYFTVVSSLSGCGDHRADVADFTTCNLASSYNEAEPKAQNGAHSFAVLAQERKFMLWWPDLGSGATSIDQACLDSIKAMIPHWPVVDAVLLDEVGGDEADVDRLCDEFTAAVESFGLEPKPLWVGFTVEDLLHRTGYQSNRIDVCVFEAYIHPKYQNELDVLDILDDIIDSQLERLGSRPKAMVCQGYRQERNGIKWTNMQSLSAVNRRTIERAQAIPDLKALLIFTLVRPPDDGSLEIGLVPEHRALLS